MATRTVKKPKTKQVATQKRKPAAKKRAAAVPRYALVVGAKFWGKNGLTFLASEAQTWDEEAKAFSEGVKLFEDPSGMKFRVESIRQ